MTRGYLQTPLGTAIIVGDGEFLQTFTLTDEEVNEFKIPAPLKSASQQIHEYFEGSRKKFDLKIQPIGTPFQQKVWKALMDIPYGSTTSYLELSRQLGDEKAIRAVAAANGKNPLWVIVPCHRVIGTDGSLTGYAGGLWRKEWLLNHERVEKQLSLF